MYSPPATENIVGGAISKNSSWFFMYSKLQRSATRRFSSALNVYPRNCDTRSHTAPKSFFLSEKGMKSPLSRRSAHCDQPSTGGGHGSQSIRSVQNQSAIAGT